MNSVYFIGGKYMGCFYVRCYLPMLHNGWNGNRRDISVNGMKTPQEVLNEINNYDIIVFHRAESIEHHKLAIVLKQMGKKIVFDNDDTFKFDKEHPFFNSKDKTFKEKLVHKNNIINNFILNADLVTCSTEHLRNEYLEINKNVIVLPNYIDEDDWGIPLRNKTDKIRIGVVGSVAYAQDFEIIKEVIKDVSKMDEVTLVLFGLPSRKSIKTGKLIAKYHQKELDFWLNLKNIEHVPWVEMEDYFDTLNELRLDFMIIPRRENDFNRAKSNLKFLEASMLEIPVIAQSFSDGTSPYDKDINGINGMLATDKNDWYVKIMTMISNREMRLDIGSSAKDYVLQNYNIKNNAHRWDEAYSTIWN